MHIEINGAMAEAMDIANGETDDEVGIWIPCSKEIQEMLDGQEVNLKIEVVE